MWCTIICCQGVVENGFVTISEVSCKAFPHKYSAQVVCWKFLQMPLVCIVVGHQKPGQSLSYLIENYSGMNYQGVYQLLISHKESSDSKQISKQTYCQWHNLDENENWCYTAVVTVHHT